ncbi:MAG: competence protein ComK [Bacilli bacterium]
MEFTCVGDTVAEGRGIMLVNADTCAISMVCHMQYASKTLFRTGETLLSEVSVKQLIEEACIRGGSTYEGRRLAMKERFLYKQCTPIPIIPHEGIFAFPTATPTSEVCVWVFPNHLTGMVEISDGVALYFGHNQRIVVHASLTFLKTQLERVSYVEKVLGRK